ncbi:hypothetical protein FGG08_006320 [Glutinoglossum americanum]|uniref:Zn(2)-C6 fungal-type domain-containing protein n=1 Tax=Glutinoglossum americanum TaxID=1670608 RepID=A0A9P8HSW5_9PEZI|nr:hypothetical protein FGG08_006320 [Glutinoglossum americanum]
MASYSNHNAEGGYSTPPAGASQVNGQLSTPTPFELSPQSSPTPKNVSFELLWPESPTYRARLPMRVQIFPHDTTDSIITTVKNFYGLYDGPGGAKGVSFEDEHGNTLIARYENFRNAMIVYVRVVLEYPDSSSAHGPPSFHSTSPRMLAQQVYYGGPQYHMPPPQPAQVLSYGQPPSRPNSRAARKRSISPQSGRGRRSASASTNRGNGGKTTRSHSAVKSRGSSTHGSHHDPNSDAVNGYSSSDGGHGSVSGSRKAKSEQLASAEISLDNIVEGGRRKRAKFESSELPLFVPPQVPLTASSSSVSPGRRSGNDGPPSFAHPGQRTFAYSHQQQPTYGYGAGDKALGYFQQPVIPYSPANQHEHHLRNRANATHPGNVPGILPTPDPTIASCISDEDVAMQLMRLGDVSNISSGTRNSTSTVDDALSGAADFASSTCATSDSDNEAGSETTEQPTLPERKPIQRLDSSPIMPPGSIKKRHKHLDEILPSFDSTEPSGDETARADDDYVDHGDESYAEETRDRSFVYDHDEASHDDRMQGLEEAAKLKDPKSKPVNGTNKGRSRTSSVKSGKQNKPRPNGPSKVKAKVPASSAPKVPISPTSLPPQSRKHSVASTLNFQHQLGADEEDLSSKPRCQRCRKSKKGCDRQRPCQRCKDAGIGVEGCVSEDEGNGRKGRYGRHMGVPVKKLDVYMSQGEQPSEAGNIVGAPQGVTGSPDKSKKRKR